MKLCLIAVLFAFFAFSAERVASLNVTCPGISTCTCFGVNCTEPVSFTGGATLPDDDACIAYCDGECGFGAGHTYGCGAVDYDGTVCENGGTCKCTSAALCGGTEPSFLSDVYTSDECTAACEDACEVGFGQQYTCLGSGAETSAAEVSPWMGVATALFGGALSYMIL